MNKVNDGTAAHDQPALCLSCTHVSRVRGTSLDEEFMTCSEIGGVFEKRITFKVTSCSSYQDRSRPNLRHMEQIAWSLVTDREKNRIGFLSPTDFNRAKKHGTVPSQPDIIDPFSGREY